MLFIEARAPSKILDIEMRKTQLGADSVKVQRSLMLSIIYSNAFSGPCTDIGADSVKVQRSLKVSIIYSNVFYAQ